MNKLERLMELIDEYRIGVIDFDLFRDTRHQLILDELLAEIRELAASLEKKQL